MADWSVVRWVAGKLFGLPPRHSRHVRVERDMPICLPDGVVLRADRHYPAGQPLCTGTDLLPTRQEVFHDPIHASALRLTIVGV